MSESETIFPPGYEAWVCPICMAACTFEAMQQCARRFHGEDAECGYFNELPEAAGGAFEFMKPIEAARIADKFPTRMAK